MTKKIGAGTLFEKDAHSRFMTLTGSRYDAMATRLRKKGYPELPFTKDEAREHVLAALGSHEDGFIRCSYCTGFFTLVDVAADHEIPLSRGGSPELRNIGYPCQRCNNQKGSLTPAEFRSLLAFLETTIPLGRSNVLSRLEISVQLAAGQRSTAAVVNKLRKSGDWGKAQKEMRDARKAKASGLGKF